MEITKEKLIEFGFTEVNDIVILMEKSIDNRNPINNDHDDTDIKLVVHRAFNSPMFAVLFPDGGMLNFIANSIDDLKKFESMLSFYDCPY